MRKVPVTKSVQIRPGCDLECIVLENQGNQACGWKPSDVKIKLNRPEHAEYKRAGNDLVYTKKISLLDALSQKPVTFQTLDGRTLTISCSE